MTRAPSIDQSPADRADPVILAVQLDPEQLDVVAERVAAILDGAPDRQGVAPATPEPAWPEWLDVKTAARYLSTTVVAVRKLYERRRVPHYQEAPGCKVYLRRSELDAFMEAGKRSPAVSNGFPAGGKAA